MSPREGACPPSEQGGSIFIDLYEKEGLSE